MARKRWTPNTDITPELLNLREKKKWQINLRRYVVEKSPCPSYAPYFGLDINSLRAWFECQFTGEMSWDNFGKAWQIGHIIPLAYFNLSEHRDLKRCWSFLNLRVEDVVADKARPDMLGARRYFEELYKTTGYSMAKDLLDHITRQEELAVDHSKPQQDFVQKHITYLKELDAYTDFEFELLNHGRSVEEITREASLLKKNS